MTGAGESGIAKQILLFPFLYHLLFLVGRVVAGTGRNHGKLRLLTGTSAADAELVGRIMLLLFFFRSRFHTPLTFTILAWRPL